jgi:hypothetical protein
VKIAEFTVVEVTPINENLNRVCIEGGFKDSSARVVFQTAERLTLGQVLTVDSSPAAAYKIESEPAKFSAEPAPAKKKSRFSE